MADSPVLTTIISTTQDLKRTRRELEMLEDFLHQAGLRGSRGEAGKAVKLPSLSRQLDELAQDNQLNLLKKTDRERLAKFLSLLLQKAPVLHFTFASEPSASSLKKLLIWLRANIHPQVLLSIGIQPSIAAGCYVRTANKQFDFTLRHSMDEQTDLLMKNIRMIDSEKKETAPAAPGASQ